MISPGIFVLALILFFNQKKDVENSSVLHRLASDNNFSLDKAELSSSLLLNLDDNCRKFLAVEPKNHEYPQLIDLHKFVECKLKVKEAGQKPGQRNLISLNLIPENSENKPVEILFYDEFDKELFNCKGLKDGDDM